MNDIYTDYTTQNDIVSNAFKNRKTSLRLTFCIVFFVLLRFCLDLLRLNFNSEILSFRFLSFISLSDESDDEKIKVAFDGHAGDFNLCVVCFKCEVCSEPEITQNM